MAFAALPRGPGALRDLVHRARRRLRVALRYDRTLIVLASGALPAGPAPEGFELLAMARGRGPGPEIARAAMLDAGEPDEVAARLAHGDEFFAWVQGEVTAAFGWITHCDRTIGLRRCRERPGRAFIYNFQTRPEFRGRGLYPALLRHARATVAAAGASEFIVDVDAANVVSLHGIMKAGFVPIGRTTTRLLASRFRSEVPGLTIERDDAALFVVPGRLVTAV